MIVTLVFEKNAIFRRKLSKIAENCYHNIGPRFSSRPAPPGRPRWSATPTDRTDTAIGYRPFVQGLVRGHLHGATGFRVARHRAKLESILSVCRLLHNG
jgi:hypothetical protein